MPTPTVSLRSIYNFNLHAPAILGQGYRAARVTTVGMDYSDAIRIQGDLVALHRQAYPYLPTGTPRSARDLTYIKVQTSSGEDRVIALEWLSGQPDLIERRTIRVMVYDRGTEDLRILRDLLISRGFTSIDVGFE